jgi:hypothetical protein
MLRFKNEKEAKQYLTNKIPNTRASSALHKGDKGHDTLKDVYNQAVDALRHLQSVNGHLLHTGPVGARIEAPKSRADTDNIGKGILDALQGIIYKNDKQVACIREHKGEDIFEGLI